MMRIVGLTGGIGMGKSTVAGMMRRLRIPVSDADAAVHRLMSPGGKAFDRIQAAFPDALCDGLIDRRVLGHIVFGNPAKLRQLERILHPLVVLERHRFLARCCRRRIPLVVLDVPLLFETGLHSSCHAVITVSAPGFVQRRRVLARPGMTPEKLAAIQARLMPDAVKNRLADAVLRTGTSKAATFRQLQAMLKRLDSSHARNRPRYRNHRR